MKYMLVYSKAGWIIQNTNTYAVVAGPYNNKTDAENALNKLNNKKM